jgi:CubicO group peptidase (beta-lactamase class C family)
MVTASYRHADYLARDNRALIHKRLPNGDWAALYDRNPDAEAPAGGGSASLNDMLRFLRLQLGDGTLDGNPIIGAKALAATHVPQVISGTPDNAAERASFYALGWNVSYDDEGRARVGHSGAFALGTATYITFLPGEEVGLVVLTNGEPIGVAEAIGATFLDIAQNGRPTVDWVGFLGRVIAAMESAGEPATDYATAPTDTNPAAIIAAYAGTYANRYYGPLVVSDSGARLSMTLGPGPTTFALDHFDGDTFSFETIGENATGLAGAIFSMADDGKAARVVLDFYNETGLGTFVRE